MDLRDAQAKAGTLSHQPQRRFVSAPVGAVCDHPDVTTLPSPDPDLRRRLDGVRGLLLDMDGVLVLRDAVIAGAVEALAALDAAAIPYLLATNTSIVGRATLSLELGRAGLSIPADRIVSAASAASAYSRRHFAGQPIYVLVAPDARAEFEGQRLLSHDEAAQSGASAAAVVIGDAGDEFTPRNLQTAFTLLRGGARFVAMHKNRWWITPAGVMLDSGAYVAALEFGSQKRALVTGKPSRAFFGEAVRMLAELGGHRSGARLSPGEVAMVGDDLWNDIRGAQKAGLRGVFVLSGKHGKAELARAAAERGGREPDAIAPSIVEVVAALA
jgi:HAD superfamily hydrolase (TIGR01458 family)